MPKSTILLLKEEILRNINIARRHLGFSFIKLDKYWDKRIYTNIVLAGDLEQLHMPFLSLD